jgi:hypothetical protein
MKHRNPRRSRLQLTARQAKSLRLLVAYTFEAEAKHYTECEPHERANHIFETLRLLASVCGRATEAKLAAVDAALASSEEV